MASPGEAFQSTRSARSATTVELVPACEIGYFNPRAPRGARRQAGAEHHRSVLISIHALREERDPRCGGCGRLPRNFNPRAPRGAVPVSAGRAPAPPDFNPRAPRGARPLRMARPGRHGYFNPRAPRGARPWTCSWAKPQRSFQSTRSARSATRQDYHEHRVYDHFNPRAPRGARQGGQTQTFPGL